ncbi:hypothetical protein RJT17_36920 [Streptomyces sp. P5-A9]|uniref:hypothetical protein n=1 Tax=Streptomyces sp. P5-A9 TaxID=3071730 RepID=UPI002FCB5C3F
MGMNGARDAGDEHRGVVAGVEVQVPPAVDPGHVRGGGLDEVCPPVVPEYEECHRVQVILGRVVDPGDVQAAMDNEAIFHRVVIGGPELFDGVHRAVVAFAGLDLVRGRGGHALAPVLVSAALRSCCASSCSVAFDSGGLWARVLLRRDSGRLDAR